MLASPSRIGWSSARDERLAAMFYRHVDPGDVADRPPEAIVGAVRHQLAVAAQRSPGRPWSTSASPTNAADGWTVGRTVVTVVTDDMPFLVDSVSAELSRLGVGIHLVVHPIVAVTRDEQGMLLRADPPGTGADIEPTLPEADLVGVLESWMQLEVDWQPDPARLGVIEECLYRILDDVRRAVTDWPRLVAAARGLAARLIAQPPRGVADEQVKEAVDLLSWLADDHFTFLGYREYHLTGRDGGPGEPDARRRGRQRPGPAANRADRVGVLLGAAARRPSARAGARAAHRHQGQPTLDGAPPGLSRLRRDQDVRPVGSGGRGVPVHRAVRGLGIHPVGRGHPRDRRARPPGARDPGVQPGLARRARPDGLPRDLPARRAVRHRQRGAGGDGRCRA